MDFWSFYCGGKSEIMTSSVTLNHINMCLMSISRVMTIYFGHLGTLSPVSEKCEYLVNPSHHLAENCGVGSEHCCRFSRTLAAEVDLICFLCFCPLKELKLLWFHTRRHKEGFNKVFHIWGKRTKERGSDFSRRQE